MATVECAGAEQRSWLHGVSWQMYLELRDSPENEHVRHDLQSGGIGDHVAIEDA